MTDAFSFDRRKLLQWGTSLALVGSPGRRADAASADSTAFVAPVAGGPIMGFGVNYGLASASAYRFFAASGAAPRETVIGDLDHLCRLGLDGLRLCFWGDWENSDAEGNLVDNEHLRMLELIIAEAERRHLAILLSPIVTYDASWPDAMQASRRGISATWKKEVLGTDPAAIRAQALYLRQLMQHRSRISGRTIADERAIVAVEPVNEPDHHPENKRGSVAYIDTLAAALRAGGWKRSIVYNVSQDMAIADAVADAQIDGVVLAWYPTGLQNGHPMGGNQLLLVESFPELDDSRLEHRAKLIYEFDAADSMATYMYPAMAREFRAGGAQFAAMFSYDSLPIASGNLEFNDHWLNLVHTPGKALSLMIAGEAFRRIHPGDKFGRYPENMRFAGVRVDDEANLAELVDAETYLHTADTTTPAPSPRSLQRIAGCGSSSVAQYRGLGAYFLNKLAPGAWRLEVYPDAIVVSNPFDEPSKTRRHTRIVRAERLLTLRLADLGSNYVVDPAEDGPRRSARNGSISVAPGVYLLRRYISLMSTVIDAKSFHAPPGEKFAPIIMHDPAERLLADTPWQVSVRIAHSESAIAVTLWVRRDGRFTSYALAPGGSDFDFVATVPAASMPAGEIDYFVSVSAGGAITTEPAAMSLTPADWDFARVEGWRSAVVASDAPVRLFVAERDRRKLIFPYGGYQPVAHMGFVSGADGSMALRIDGAGLATAPEHDLSCQLNLAWPGTAPIGDRSPRLLVRGRAVTGKTARVGIILVERDGACWGGSVTLPPSLSTIELPIAWLAPCEASMLPKGFPAGAMSYWLPRPERQKLTGAVPDLKAVQAIQIAMAGRFSEAGDDPTAIVEIHEVVLV